MKTALKEQWSLLASKGGRAAGAYWLARRVLGVDVYKFMSRSLLPGGVLLLHDDADFLQLQSRDDLTDLDPKIVAQIDAHCGFGLYPSIDGGRRVYALVGEGGVLCQLSIDTGTGYLSTPCPLVLRLAERECFLSFLYTHPTARRQGRARRLIERVFDALGQEGFTACHTHVQSTNVASLNTFRSAGCRTSGWLTTIRAGRYLATYKKRGLHLTVERWRVFGDLPQAVSIARATNHKDSGPRRSA
jgi:ribosomal protein S18 acetylase RimI-like enzyme